ncbi:unnamed protein product [Arctogadus glacialis]
MNVSSTSLQMKPPWLLRSAARDQSSADQLHRGRLRDDLGQRPPPRRPRTEAASETTSDRGRLRDDLGQRPPPRRPWIEAATAERPCALCWMDVRCVWLEIPLVGYLWLDTSVHPVQKDGGGLQMEEAEPGVGGPARPLGGQRRREELETLGGRRINDTEAILKAI